MRIKFVDLAAQDAEISDDVERRFSEVKDATAYVGGPTVAAFEREFAEFLGVRNVVGVASGTDALRLALAAMGIGAGDGVITSPMTFIATVAAIVQSGAHPVFVDIDYETGNLSVPALLQHLDTHRSESSKGVRAILPVDLYGLPAPMPELREIANRHHLGLLEDSCQAHGARIRMGDQWMMSGDGVADASCFSFYPGKNLGAWGDGGAVTSNDDALAGKVRKLRDHGRVSHYEHSEIGCNSRLDSLQAAVLSSKLSRLADWNRRRRTIAALYGELLAGTDLELPREAEGFESCYHLYVVRTAHRDRIGQALTEADIAWGIHYPIPLHLQPACRFLGYQPGDLPAAEKFAARVISLPMHPHLRDEEVEEIAQVVRSAIA